MSARRRIELFLLIGLCILCWVAVVGLLIWAFAVLSLSGYRSDGYDRIAVVVYLQLALALVLCVNASMLTLRIWSMGPRRSATAGSPHPEPH